MKLKLPNSLCSPQDLKAATLEVREYARWFAHASVKKRLGAGKTAAPPDISQAAHALIKDWHEDKPLNREGLDQLISTLEEYGTKAPHMHITLAALPPNKLKETLIAWCREHIAPDVLVTFDFDSTLLGGLVVRYGSRIFDWSFHRQIMAARERFPEVLRRV